MSNSRAGETVIQRVVRVLAAFDSGDVGLSVAEIARRAELPESTARRMVHELVDEGLLEREGRRRVSIGNRLWAQVSRGSPTLSLRDAATGYMEDIQSVVGHHTALSVLDGDEVLYIERLGARNSTVSIATLAARLPWHLVSAGLVLVAHGDEGERDRRLRRRLVRRTPETVTDPAQLREILEQTRRVGYSVCEATSVPSSSGISVPVRDSRGEVVAALGVIVPVGDEHLAATLPLLLAASRGISRALGWGGGRDSGVRLSR